MDSNPKNTPDESPRPRLATATLIVTALLGLFYAYAVWSAIGNALRYSAAYAEINTAAPILLFLLGILVPVLIFTAAFLFGRRRALLELAVALFAGLAVTAALSLGLIALNQVLFTNLVLAR